MHLRSQSILCFLSRNGSDKKEKHLHETEESLEFSKYGIQPSFSKQFAKIDHNWSPELFSDFFFLKKSNKVGEFIKTISVADGASSTTASLRSRRYFHKQILFPFLFLFFFLKQKLSKYLEKSLVNCGLEAYFLQEGNQHTTFSHCTVIQLANKIQGHLLKVIPFFFPFLNSFELRSQKTLVRKSPKNHWFVL